MAAATGGAECGQRRADAGRIRDDRRRRWRRRPVAPGAARDGPALGGSAAATTGGDGRGQRRIGAGRPPQVKNWSRSTMPSLAVMLVSPSPTGVDWQTWTWPEQARFDMDLIKQKNHWKLIWRNVTVCNPVASLCSLAASTWQMQNERYKFGVNDALLARRKYLN
nr:uncharacterized protein LOC127331953 [Lolium perenne]